MRFAVNAPPFAEPAALVELGVAGERAGWDAFLMWDHMVLDRNGIPIADPNGGVIDSITYSYPSPQVGISQGRLPDGSSQIVFFPGTESPGEGNYLPLTNVAVNEVLSHADPPLEDAIELANLTGVPMNIAGWYLSSRRRRCSGPVRRCGSRASSHRGGRSSGPRAGTASCP